MNSILRYKTMVFIACALWLLANWSGTHGHFCFDGQEPMVSIHMHLDGQIHEHHPDEVHQDTDVEMSQSMPAKLSKIDLNVILLAFIVLGLVVVSRQLFADTYRFLSLSSVAYWRPPLRAPPLSV